MSRFENKKVIPRYIVIALVLGLIGITVICKAAYIIAEEEDYWLEVAKKVKKDSLTVSPHRGNILSADGELMASTLPEYKVFIDFRIESKKRDTIWRDSADVISEGLHRLFPSKSAEEFKAHLQKGYDEKKAHWPIVKGVISYDLFREIRRLPMFCEAKYTGGFHYEEFNARKRPFGSLAERTVGGMNRNRDSARYGLELAYDNVLCGTNGYEQKRKVLNKFIPIPITPPEDGLDIVTTIDVHMQDLAERALVDELELINGDMGVAILMEVKTGDVKAIVNMRRSGNDYNEVYNDAISYRCEPGSVFKVASFLVALDDGLVDTTFVINTGNGVMKMHGRDMKDHNWRRGGYQSINMARALEVSSNIGVSYVIDHFYGNNPEKFVEGLYRVGIAEDLQLPITGYLKPIIRMPKKVGRQYTNWSATALPWMSIGYETQIAPINTLAFYNAIANDGKMVQPRFVKALMKDGEIVEELEPTILKEQIAKPATIEKMQTILEHVVSQGLGRKAGSRMFKVAGKTGTAQVSKGAAGYTSGTVDYWLTFAGYFPADEPQYSCIVCLKKSGLPASGGGMSGLVFHHIAEGVMSRNMRLTVDDAVSEEALVIPNVKAGDMSAASYVFDYLCLDKDEYGSSTSFCNVAIDSDGDTIPDVRGMGAKDAIYTLESMGLKVSISGSGQVVRQSIEPGSPVVKGESCMLELKVKC